jgi:hypothetical protein
MRVFESHVLEPTFFSSMYEGTTWPAVMFMVVVASGKLWLTNCAA